MSTERLNLVTTLHVHTDLLDCIDDSAVVKDFVVCNKVRKDVVGKGLNLAEVTFPPLPQHGTEMAYYVLMCR